MDAVCDRGRVLVLLLLLLFVSASQGAKLPEEPDVLEEASCAEILEGHALLFSLSEELQSFPYERKDNEHLESGESLKGVVLDSLSDGAYVYLIDVDGNIFYAPRFSFDSVTGDVLNTHGSLFSRMERKAAKPPLVAMAGEFYLTAGRVSKFNNKSGKWRGGRDHLVTAARLFRAMGLQFGDEVLTDFSSLSREINHSLERLLSVGYKATFQDELLKAQFGKLVELYRDVYKLFPENPQGEIDAMGVLRFSYVVYGELGWVEHEVSETLFFLSESYKDPGSFVFTFWRLHEKGVVERVIRALEELIEERSPSEKSSNHD